MRSNGSHPVMSPLDAQSHLVFQRLSRQIGKVTKSAGTDAVHKFRTYSRRVEALVSELGCENGNQKKLLKLLSKLRKKAGKVRDLDVQIAFLKELKVPDRQNQRTQLIDSLDAEQVKRKKKLEKALTPETSHELRKRLRRAQDELGLTGVDPLKLSYKRLPDPGTTQLSEKMLHACRIEAKKARYLAELAPESPARNQFVAELKHAQDAIGEWHDTMKLKERAEQLFGGVSESALVSVLQNISRAKFRRATTELLSAIAAIQKLRIPPESVPTREPVTLVPQMRHAVA